MSLHDLSDLLKNVAPLAGAWIEIDYIAQIQEIYNPSLPSRERGLKSYEPDVFGKTGLGRSPRGSVD